MFHFIHRKYTTFYDTWAYQLPPMNIDADAGRRHTDVEIKYLNKARCHSATTCISEISNERPGRRCTVIYMGCLATVTDVRFASRSPYSRRGGCCTLRATKFSHRVSTFLNSAQSVQWWYSIHRRINEPWTSPAHTFPVYDIYITHYICHFLHAILNPSNYNFIPNSVSYFSYFGGLNSNYSDDLKSHTYKIAIVEFNTSTYPPIVTSVNLLSQLIYELKQR